MRVEKETHVHTTQEASYCFPSLGLKNALKERRRSIRDPVHQSVFFLVIFRIFLMSEGCQKAAKLNVKEDISQNYVQIPVDDRYLINAVIFSRRNSTHPDMSRGI